MAEVPSEEEVMNAMGKLGKLRNRKAAGESGILPEMVKATCREEEFVNKCWIWRMTFGRQAVLGAITSLGPSPRKVISPTVTIRGVSHYWMWWGRLQQGFGKRGFRSWLRMKFQNHSVAFGAGEAVQT